MNMRKLKEDSLVEHYRDVASRVETIEITRDPKNDWGHRRFWRVDCYDHNGRFIGGTCSVPTFEQAQHDAHLYGSIITWDIYTRQIIPFTREEVFNVRSH